MPESLWNPDSQEIRWYGLESFVYSGDYIKVERYSSVHAKTLEEAISELKNIAEGLEEPKVFLCSNSSGKPRLCVEGWTPLTEEERVFRENLRTRDRRAKDDAESLI